MKLSVGELRRNMSREKAIEKLNQIDRACIAVGDLHALRRLAGGNVRALLYKIAESVREVKEELKEDE